jgi:hypothetical protein
VTALVAEESDRHVHRRHDYRPPAQCSGQRDATGSSSWSEHAFGLAVDLNPCENPYVSASGYEAHKRCRKYVDRSRHGRGIIHAGDKVVRAFASVGWS